MPFEPGLVLGWLQTSRSNNHTWFRFEAVKRRVSKSLSDPDGTDPYIHALVRNGDQPTVGQMYGVYRKIKTASPLIIEECGG